MDIQSPEVVSSRWSRNLVWLLFVAIFAVTLYAKFRTERASGEIVHQQSKLTQRLEFAGFFCESLPSFMRSALRSLALGLETQPERKALWSGQDLSAEQVELLDPEMLLYREHSLSQGAEQTREISSLAYRGLMRLNQGVMGFGILSLTSFCCVFFGSTESKPPNFETSLQKVFGVFLVWDCTTFWLITRLASDLPWTGFPSMLAAQGLSYFLLLVLLRLAWGKSLADVFKGFALRWVGWLYFPLVVSIYVWEALLSSGLGRPLDIGADFWLVWQHLTQMQSLVLAVLVVLVAPVFEELMFRGWLQEGLRSQLGSRWALLVSSALFAFFHGQVEALPGLFFLGIFLGYARLKSGSIWASILLHIMWNATVLCVFWISLP